MTIFVLKTQFFPESGSGKHFHGSGMRSIDSLHKVIPRWIIFRKNAIFATFRFNTQAFSVSGKRFFASKMLNSDSPHVFTSRGVISRKNFHVVPPIV